MKETDIIIREVPEEERRSGRPFSYFGWEGTDALAFDVISDGYWECAKVLVEKMANSTSIEEKDSWVYPMFFNYRHSIETFLKYLFFRYSEETEDAKKQFLEIGHDLQSLWKNLRPYLDKKKKAVGSSVNMNAIEHYIKSINKFDANSMIMRYPINKNLKANKDKELHFDFLYFGERMDTLCDALHQLAYDIQNLTTESATVDELSIFLNDFEEYRSQIDEYLSLLKKEAEREDVEKLCSISIDEHTKTDDLDFLEDSNASSKFLEKCEPDLQILLEALFVSGRSVNQNTTKLSQSPVHRQKEFVKLCYELLSKSGLRFGEKPEPHQLCIFEKASDDLLLHISKAISILDLTD